MATTSFARKGNTDMLAELQAIGYPQLTGFAWGTAGEFTVDSPAPLSAGAMADILAFTHSDNAWGAAQS